MVASSAEIIFGLGLILLTSGELLPQATIVMGPWANASYARLF